MVASNLPSAIGLDLSDRAHVIAIAQGQEWSISDLVLGRKTKEAIFAVSRAVQDEAGNLKGILVATIDGDRLQKELSFERGKSAAISIVDRNGMLVFRSPKLEATWEERNWLKAYPMYKESLEGREYTGNVVAEYDNKARIFAIVPLPFGWVAGAGRSEDEIIGTAFSQIKSSLVVFGVVLTVALIAVAIVSTLITRSVLALQAKSDAVSRGEYVAKEHLSATKEFQGLSKALGEMSEKVRARENALRDSEQRMRLAQQAARIGTFEVNIQTGKNVWPPEMEAIYGLQPGEFAKTVQAWEELVHPEDRAEAVRLAELSS